METCACFQVNENCLDKSGEIHGGDISDDYINVNLDHNGLTLELQTRRGDYYETM